jgi:hypothetical protein
MRRFFFHLQNRDGVIPDNEGVVRQDLESARSTAVAGARELMGSDLRYGILDLDQSIVIVDQAGMQLDEVQFATVFKIVCTDSSGSTKAINFCRERQPLVFDRLLSELEGSLVRGQSMHAL